MKKKLCISLAVLLIFGAGAVAFALEAPDATGGKTGELTTTGENTVALATVATTSPAATTTSAVTETTSDAIVTTVSDMSFTGDTIQLSLEDAYKKMLADSPGAKMAELNRKSADGVAKGYGESVQSLNRLEADISAGTASATAEWSYDSSDKNMLKANRTYATAQGPKNYEAELNNLKTDTLKNYYSLKELENQEKIAKDNLALSEKLLANTRLKYKLGTVAKNDVLKAEISANEAKDQYMAAENGLKTMKMGFNQFMGYDLMQNVTLTDVIKEVPLSTKTLDDSIKSALANRNEMFEAAYKLEIANLNFKNYSAYPKNSSKYIKAEMGVLMAETGNKNAPLSIESDVRNKYMEMNQKYSAVQTGKKSVENAIETVRLAQLQYDAGMATLSDVEGAQIASFNTQLAYSKTLLEYNLAVNAYNLSSGVGVDVAMIP